MRVNYREQIKNLDWLESATDKEIEDEKIILGEELDEIAHQLKCSDGTDYGWYRRAVHAAKERRATLRLIGKIQSLRVNNDNSLDPRNYLSGEKKHQFDISISQNRALKARIEKKEKTLDKKRRIIISQGDRIKTLKGKVSNLSKLLQDARNKNKRLTALIEPK